MKNQNRPRVVIGMPVYNGEKHIRETIDSILAQTFTDFRLLISDNASTDATGEICCEYAQQDDRVVYHRQSENLGFARNFNYVFQPDGALYFKWAAHDDLLKPDYLLQCYERLEQDSSLSMAHCAAVRIDDASNELGMYNNLKLNGARVRDRFWQLLWIIDIYEIYGLMRSDCVAKTNLAGTYVGSERTLLAKMLFQGDIAYMDAGLFSRRDHAGSQTAIQQTSDYTVIRQAQAPKSKIPSLLAPAIRFQKYLEAIAAIPMPLSERLACIRMLAEWGIRRGVEGATGATERYQHKMHAELWATNE